MFWILTIFAVVYPGLTTAITDYFCPLNDTLPKCDEMFQNSNFSELFGTLDEVINLDGVMDSLDLVSTFCSNLDEFKQLVICSGPALSTCRPKRIRRLNLFTDTHRLLAGLQLLCQSYQNVSCEDKTSLSGVGAAIPMCLSRVKQDAASPSKLLDIATDQQLIERYCSIYDATSAFFQPALLACGEAFSSVFTQLREGARPPPCDTPTTIAISHTTDPTSSSGIVVPRLLLLVLHLFLLM